MPQINKEYNHRKIMQSIMSSFKTVVMNDSQLEAYNDLVEYLETTNAPIKDYEALKKLIGNNKPS